MSALILLAIPRFLYIFFVRHKPIRPTRQAMAHQPLPPAGPPLVGNLPFLDPELHTYFSALAQTYGPILTPQLGNKIGIVITFPAAALEDHDVAGREAARHRLDPVWPQVADVEEGLRPRNAQQRHARLRLHPPPARVPADDELHLQSGRVGSRINIGEQMLLTVLHVITSTLWGGTVKDEERGRLGRSSVRQ
ncbi:cytochrome P450, family 706, subfamily A, polypeptide 7 [Actinidia rufa]|uniref:Cytochrome P450, family 706, subfamily A, polypeptide 7 n=1 Tax=Actinidia rufa TaxID=165716 RepID=A0A7J0FR58_9ERIC|nr:cytochrome P450, family 706, subfamily A, polypeptide 7 [Actinidia rufa]